MTVDYRSDEDIETTQLIEIEPTGVGAGLINSGNTCFIASVLQCFTHTVPLIEALQFYKYQNPCYCGSETFCVLHNLRNHIGSALKSSGLSLRIDHFLHNLNHFSPEFEMYNQEDAQEFQQALFAKLEQCCGYPRTQPESRFQDIDIGDHVFGGRLMSRLNCCNCNAFTDKVDPSLGWSLEIEDVDNLEDALDSFTSVEKLDGEFTCDSCKKQVSKEKQLMIDKLPLVPTIHLKRFKSDGNNLEKNSKYVEFPLEIDLLPYMKHDKSLDVSTKYHLYAFVEHIGNSLSCGHYTSYVRSAPKIWHNFDDSKVTRISEDDVLLRYPYMLFYAREETPWFFSIFEKLQPFFKATRPLNSSPQSVIRTSSIEESGSDHSHEMNLDNSIKASLAEPSLDGSTSDFRCLEPQEEVFHSRESSSDHDNTYTAETSHQVATMDNVPEPDQNQNSSLRKRKDCDGDMLNGTKEKIQKQDSLLQPVLNTTCTEEFVSVGVPNPDETASNFHYHEPQEEIDHNYSYHETQVLFTKNRKASEGAKLVGSHGPKSKIQKQGSVQKSQGSFRIERSHLKIKKTEESRSNFIISSSSANPKDKEIAVSYLKKRDTYRHRMLAGALDSSSPNRRRYSS